MKLQPFEKTEVYDTRDKLFHAYAPHSTIVGKWECLRCPALATTSDLRPFSNEDHLEDILDHLHFCTIPCECETE